MRDPASDRPLPDALLRWAQRRAGELVDELGGDPYAALGVLQDVVASRLGALQDVAAPAVIAESPAVIAESPAVIAESPAVIAESPRPRARGRSLRERFADDALDHERESGITPIAAARAAIMEPEPELERAAEPAPEAALHDDDSALLGPVSDDDSALLGPVSDDDDALLGPVSDNDDAPSEAAGASEPTAAASSPEAASDINYRSAGDVAAQAEAALVAASRGSLAALGVGEDDDDADPLAGLTDEFEEDADFVPEGPPPSYEDAMGPPLLPSLEESSLPGVPAEAAAEAVAAEPAFEEIAPAPPASAELDEYVDPLEGVDDDPPAAATTEYVDPLEGVDDDPPADAPERADAGLDDLGPPHLPGLDEGVEGSEGVEEAELPPPPPSPAEEISDHGERSGEPSYDLGLPGPHPDDQWKDGGEWSDRSFLLGIPDDDAIAAAAAEMKGQPRESDAPQLRRRDPSSRSHAAAPAGESAEVAGEVDEGAAAAADDENVPRAAERRRSSKAVVVLHKKIKRRRRSQGGDEYEEIDEFEEITDDDVADGDEIEEIDEFEEVEEAE